MTHNHIAAMIVVKTMAQRKSESKKFKPEFKGQRPQDHHLRLYRRNHCSQDHHFHLITLLIKTNHLRSVRQAESVNSLPNLHSCMLHATGALFTTSAVHSGHAQRLSKVRYTTGNATRFEPSPIQP